MKTQAPITQTSPNKANAGVTPSTAGWSEHSSDWDTPPNNTPKPGPSPIALQAKDLSVRYGPNQILCNISLTLYKGDRLGLLGLNGAGKSTLLKVLAGALAPTTGTVLIGSNELYENPIETRTDIGYAPDKPAVYPEFRVVEYLTFIAKMRRIPNTKIRASIDNVLQRCALEDVRRRIIGNLSSGYQQRVNLAQALIHSPRVLILDEPANGLDPVQLLEIRDLLKALGSEQATIFSSHVLPEVSTVCNRVFLIHQKQTILDAQLNELADKNNSTFEVKLEANNNTTEFDVAALPGITAACRVDLNRWIVTGNSITVAHLNAMLNARGQTPLTINESDDYLENLFKQLGRTHRKDNKVDGIAQ